MHIEEFIFGDPRHCTTPYKWHRTLQLRYAGMEAWIRLLRGLWACAGCCPGCVFEIAPKQGPLKPPPAIQDAARHQIERAFESNKRPQARSKTSVDVMPLLEQPSRSIVRNTTMYCPVGQCVSRAVQCHHLSDSERNSNEMSCQRWHGISDRDVKIQLEF